MMTTHVRKSGLGVLGDMPWGTHCRHFYQTQIELLETLVAVASEGVFVTTDEVKDCWYCDFGDVCRVERTGEGKVKDSVLARWSEETGLSLPEYARLQALRSSDA